MSIDLENDGNTMRIVIRKDGKHFVECATKTQSPSGKTTKHNFTCVHLTQDDIKTLKDFFDNVNYFEV